MPLTRAIFRLLGLVFGVMSVDLNESKRRKHGNCVQTVLCFLAIKTRRLANDIPNKWCGGLSLRSPSVLGIWTELIQRSEKREIWTIWG